MQGFGEAYPHNPKVVSDMTALHHIHEASILYNLGERAKLDNQNPYTFMVRIECNAMAVESCMHGAPEVQHAARRMRCSMLRAASYMRTVDFSL